MRRPLYLTPEYDSSACAVCPRVELTHREIAALGWLLRRKVVLRSDVRAWAMRLVRWRLAELVRAHELLLAPPAPRVHWRTRQRGLL